MKMNAGVWIGIIGGIVGLLVAIGAVLATTGSMGIYITIGMLILFGGVFFLMFKLVIGPIMNARRLMKTGIPSKGKILEVRDTGVTINNNPQVKLVLEVKNSFGQRYTTTVRTLVSRLNPFVFQPGMEVPVRIDPKNDNNVIIDLSGQAAVGQGVTTSQEIDQAALKSQIEQMQRENDLLALSGRPARAIIKKYTWLGVNVNGNNPWAELELEVLPEHSASFPATTRGVIAEASVHKYQPGSEIHVKYDFYDNSKVVISHS